MEKNVKPGTRIIKVAVVGPESTGKTVLAENLAHYYRTEWVPEFAREYIEQINRPYTRDDLEIIAMEQINLENQLEKKADRMLICDTTLLVIKIWSEYKYGNCPGWIIEEVNHRYYDLHLLTAADIPWMPDPQREHPHKREFLYGLYQRELDALGTGYATIGGSYEERFNKAVEEIDFLLRK